MKTKILIIMIAFGSLVPWSIYGDIRYRIVRINPPNGSGAHFMAGSAINDRGVITGVYNTYDESGVRNRILGFIHSDSLGTSEFNILGKRSTIPAGINNAGQIAISTSDDDGVWRDAFIYTPDVGFVSLGSFGGGATEVESINESGQVCGLSELPGFVSSAFLYTDASGMTNLAPLSSLGSVATGINDHGEIAGAIDGQAFIFNSETGIVPIGPGVASAINNNGVVVGRAFVRFPQDDAFLYEDGQLKLLGSVPSAFPSGGSAACGVNDSKVVVGKAIIYDPSRFNYSTRAMVWTEQEGMRDLNDFVAKEPNGWHLTTICNINEYGQMTGVGTLTNGNTFNLAATYRLDPIPPKLQILSTATNMIVSWSPSWPGIVLESTEELTASDWQPMDTGGTNVVTLTGEGASQQFFRLNLDAIQGLCCAPE